MIATKFVNYTCVVLVYIFMSTFAAFAQSEPTARLLVANSTNATLTIEVYRPADPARDSVTITLPPLTEKTITVPAGLLTFVANAYRSAPAKRYEEQFALQANGSVSYNITPRKFGTSHLSDRPGMAENGISVNPSKLMIGGINSCSKTSWKNGVRWYLSGGGGTSPYYQAGNYFCRNSTEGFYARMGNDLKLFVCGPKFTKCRRKKSLDAKLSNRTKTKRNCILALHSMIRIITPLSRSLI